MAVQSVTYPSYLALYERGELRRRVEEARRRLEACTLCPRVCRANRLKNEIGQCNVGRWALVSSFGPHFGEERVLRGWCGSGTVFFAGCNLRCQYCCHPETWMATSHGCQTIQQIFQSGKASPYLGSRCASGQIRFPQAPLTTYTRQGYQAPIAKGFAHPYHGYLIFLKPFYCPPLLLTPDHEVFVCQKPNFNEIRKIRAAELTRQHRLIVPKLQPPSSPCRGIDVQELLKPYISTFRKLPRKVSYKTLQEMVALKEQGRSSREIACRYGYHLTYVRRLLARFRREGIPHEEAAQNGLVVEGERVRFKTEKRPGIPAYIPLSEDFARLLGYYCAEGHVHRQKDRPNSYHLVFSCGLHEQALAKRIQQLLQKVFRIQATLSLRKTTLAVGVGKTSLALLFLHLCGRKAHEKRVPDPIREAENSVIRAFLEAYFEGDGYDQGTHWVANTVSKELALGLFELLLRLGALPSFHEWHPPASTVIEGRTVRQSPLYYVKVRKACLANNPVRVHGVKHRDIGDHFLVPIHKIAYVPYAGSVYNVEINDPDHSYLASFVAVGNCQNYEISQLLDGAAVSPERLAEIFLKIQEMGCHNLNLVTPTHVIAQILEALELAIPQGFRLPIVYNTSGYDSVAALKLLDGVVDIYMPDLKYSDSQIAKKYSGIEHYWEVAKAAFKEMHRQVGDLVVENGLAVRGLLIRHLVLPNGLAGSREVLKFIAEELSRGSWVNIMAQYHPTYKAFEYPELSRRITSKEYWEVVEHARSLGLYRGIPLEYAD